MNQTDAKRRVICRAICRIEVIAFMISMSLLITTVGVADESYCKVLLSSTGGQLESAKRLLEHWMQKTLRVRPELKSLIDELARSESQLQLRVPDPSVFDLQLQKTLNPTLELLSEEAQSELRRWLFQRTSELSGKQSKELVANEEAKIIIAPAIIKVFEDLEIQEVYYFGQYRLLSLYRSDRIESELWLFDTESRNFSKIQSNDRLINSLDIAPAFHNGRWYFAHGTHLKNSQGAVVFSWGAGESEIKFEYLFPHLPSDEARWSFFIPNGDSVALAKLLYDGNTWNESNQWLKFYGRPWDEFSPLQLPAADFVVGISGTPFFIMNDKHSEFQVFELQLPWESTSMPRIQKLDSLNLTPIDLDLYQVANQENPIVLGGAHCPDRSETQTRIMTLRFDKINKRLSFSDVCNIMSYENLPGAYLYDPKTGAPLFVKFGSTAPEDLESSHLFVDTEQNKLWQIGQITIRDIALPGTATIQLSAFELTNKEPGFAESDSISMELDEIYITTTLKPWQPPMVEQSWYLGGPKDCFIFKTNLSKSSFVGCLKVEVKGD